MAPVALFLLPPCRGSLLFNSVSGEPAMATKSRGRDARALTQPDPAILFNDCPECGLLTMDRGRRITQVSPNARRFLGLRSRGMPELADLPAPVRSLLARPLKTRRQPSSKATTLRGWGSAYYLATLWPLGRGKGFKGCILILQDLAAAKH